MLVSSLQTSVITLGKGIRAGETLLWFQMRASIIQHIITITQMYAGS